MKPVRTKEGRVVGHVGGRKRPTPAQRKILPHLAHYVSRMADLPVAPDTLDYTAKAAPALAQVDLNDSEGDCVIAGYYHAKGVWTGNALGVPFIPTAAQINADYSAIGGYVVGDPSTDNGCDEVTAIQHWMTVGDQAGCKLAGAVQLDPSNVPLMKLALMLTEDHYFGLELADAWISPFPSGAGFVWDVAGSADPQNGHCIMGAGYNSKSALLGYTAEGVVVCTWGLLGILTWAAIAEYCSAANGGAIYSLFSPDELAAGQSKAPNGIDWTTLQADLAAVGSPVGDFMVPPGP